MLTFLFHTNVSNSYYAFNPPILIIGLNDWCTYTAGPLSLLSSLHIHGSTNIKSSLSQLQVLPISSVILFLDFQIFFLVSYIAVSNVYNNNNSIGIDISNKEKKDNPTTWGKVKSSEAIRSTNWLLCGNALVEPCLCRDISQNNTFPEWRV